MPGNFMPVLIHEIASYGYIPRTAVEVDDQVNYNVQFFQTTRRINKILPLVLRVTYFISISKIS